MRNELEPRPSRWRWLAQLPVALCGIAAIVGSGGGVGMPDMSCLNTASCGGGPFVFPEVSLGPEHVTTQVGGTLDFSATTNVVPATYSWCRRPAGGNVCVTLAGASGPSYRLSGANLGDDGSLIQVTVSGPPGSVAAQVRISVSSMPGVRYGDGDFIGTAWAVTASTVPAQNGPTANTARVATGGNPGAYQAVTYRLPVVPSSASVFLAAQAAVYDPAQQGAIYRLDMTEDCLGGTTSNLQASTAPLLEQGGRRFVAWRSSLACTGAAWTPLRRPSQSASDFELVDGPPCASGAACPDFAATGAPVRFGLATRVSVEGGFVPPVDTGHGFDNWQVTVWRR